MASLLTGLSGDDKSKLLTGIYYLNMAELRGFCDKHAIPYKIMLETDSGNSRPSGEMDRKKIIIKRVLDYLKTGKSPGPTVFPKDVVRLSGLPNEITPKTRIYYGCYDKKNPVLMTQLADCSGGEFRNGAVARILLREFWARGEAPTIRAFAAAWLCAKRDYSLDQHPEAAYLTDLSKGTVGRDWKKTRNEIAKKVLRILGRF